MRLLLISLACSTLISAQSPEPLIPFIDGAKMGLANVDGELVGEAEYNEVNIVDAQKSWFYASKGLDGAYRSYFLQGKQELISEGSFNFFRVELESLFIGTINGSSLYQARIFNTKGVDLLNRTIPEILINDWPSRRQLPIMESRYGLIKLLEQEEARGQVVSLLLYDKQEARICATIIDKGSDFKSEQTKQNLNEIKYTFKNESGEIVSVSLKIDKRIQKLILQLGEEKVMQFDFPLKYAKEQLMEDGIELEVSSGFESRSPNSVGSKSNSPKFTKNKDGQWTFNGALVKTKKDAHYFWGEQHFEKIQPKIYKRKGEYGFLVSEKKHLKAKYDTLYPLLVNTSYKNYQWFFIFGIRDKTGLLKYGLMDQNGMELFEAKYDGLYPILPQSGNIGTDFKYLLSRKEAFSVTVQNSQRNLLKNNLILCEINGKYGLINTHGKSLVSPEFDGIYWNKKFFDLEGVDEQLNDFYVFEKGGRFDYRLSLSTESESFKRELPFPMVPGIIIPNYGGKKGLTIIRMGLSMFEFKGFARADGLLYFNKK